MKKKELVLLLALIFALSGCVLRSYSVTKDRVDQNLDEGNLGYLTGNVPQAERTKERKATRKTQVVEIELHPPIRFESAPKPKSAQAIQGTSDEELWGNRGYLSRSVSPQVSIPEETAKMEQYTVEKGDTLQKISYKYYGTTKNWYKIFKANEGTLRGPDKIYPGQVLNVPLQPLKETEENLK